MAKKIMICVAIAGLLFALAPSADAAILASEDYNDGSGDIPGLTYTDTQTSITVGETGANKGLDPVTHAIDLPDDITDSGQYFVRALVRRDKDNDDWGGVSVFFGSKEMAYFGLRPSTNPENRDYWGIASPDGTSTPVDYAASSLPVDTIFFIVGMIDYDNDECKIWIDPAFGSTAPAADGTMTGWGWGNKSQEPEPPTKVELRQHGNRPLSYDEIVVGTSWGDVVPVPEPATMAVLLLGLPFVMRRRRK